VSLPIVQIDNFRIWFVIAEHDIQITIAINVNQTARIGAIWHITEVVGYRKVAPAIAEKDPAHEGPMPPFGEHNVEVTVPIKITDANVGRGFGSGLKQESTIEGGKARSLLSLVPITIPALSDLTTRR
jgi:hypothetical protein